MKAISQILCLSFFLCSCKSHVFYEDLYARKNRKQMMFKEAYQNQDNYCIHSLKICHFVELPGIRRAITGSSITLNQNIIESSMKQSYSRLLPISYCETETGFSFKQDCNSIAKSLIINQTNSSNSFDCCGNMIIPHLSITSQSGKRIEGGGGMEFAEDMGDDRHLLEFKLVTSIYENGSLIYMDNQAHWTRVRSERGEQLHYQIPQEVIETLVTLSLQEYFKRVKK